MHFPKTTLLSLAAILLPVTLAADCTAYGLCGITPASSRNQLYATRQHVCGDTTLYQNTGNYRAAGGGRLDWNGGQPQQTCWDAFDNILNQCHPEGTGLGFHGGTWQLRGAYYRVLGCY